MRSLIGLVALAMIASPALAEISPPSPAAAAADAPAPLSLEDLGEVNGRQGVEVNVLSDQQLSATSSGNSVTANTIRSGDVSFGAESLSGFSGIGNFVVNTGNNNNLQGAISVNIITAPTP